MKINHKTTTLFFFFTLFILMSCKENTDSNTNILSSDNTEVVEKTKAQKLANVIFNKKSIISSAKAPKIIKAEQLYNSLDQNILIIDIRSAKDFASGHIKNAINIKLSEVQDFAKASGLPMYDKVVMACYTGQTASYASAILQMLGHTNIYVLDWGMCGWNPKFSKKWKKNTSDKGIAELVKTPYTKNKISELPIIKNKKNTGFEIRDIRARKILKEGFGNIAVNYSYTKANAKKAYVICYQPEAIYNNGHIDQAILYDQNNSFNLSTDLLTLPPNKTIIIYSNKAYQSTYIAIYLKMLGYNARTLKFGANSFMNSKLKDSGDAFEKEVIQNYPFETSIYIKVEGEVQEGGC